MDVEAVDLEKVNTDTPTAVGRGPHMIGSSGTCSTSSSFVVNKSTYVFDRTAHPLVCIGNVCLDDGPKELELKTLVVPSQRRSYCEQ